MGDHYVSPRSSEASAATLRPIGFYDVACVQIFSLKCIGFLHLYHVETAATTSPSRKQQGKVIANYVLTACGVLLVMSGWISFGFNAAIALGFILKPDPTSTTNPIMQAFTEIPFATYNFRGVVVLTILLLKRRQWAKLVRWCRLHDKEINYHL